MTHRCIFRYKTPLTHYTAQAFVVRCFDDRFRSAFEKFLAAKKINHLDLESVAGGAKIFASPERKSDRDFLFRELEKSIRLHGTKRVMLFTHYDCGAYGGLARFGGDQEKQFMLHQAELTKAKVALIRKFPNIAVETYFIGATGVIKIA